MAIAGESRPRCTKPVSGHAAETSDRSDNRKGASGLLTPTFRTPIAPPTRG